MTFNKLPLASWVILPITIGFEAILAHGVLAENPPDAASSKEAAKPAREPKSIDPFVLKLLDAAQRHVDAQRPLYDEGRITISIFVDSLAQLEKARLLAATD